MKKPINLLFVSLIMLCFFSPAQIDSTIYGVVRSDATGQLSLSKIDVTNGLVAIISSTPFASPYQLNSIATIDPVTNKYFLHTNNFLGVDIATGIVTTSTSLSSSPPPFLEFLQFNPADGTVYAMKNAGGQLYLVKVNTSNGIVTIISSTPLSTVHFMNALAAIDPNNNIYYLQGGSPKRLYGFDLSSGNIVVNVAVDPAINDFQLMRFNSKDSVLYGIASLPMSANKYLAKLNTVSGIATLLSSTSFTNPVDFNAIATIDQDKRVFYVQINKTLMGFSLSTGNVIVNKSLTFPFPGRFDLMVYCRECRNSTSWGESPQIGIIVPAQSCINQQVPLSATSSGIPAVSYSWTATPSVGVLFIPNNTSATTNVTFSGPGTYTICSTSWNILGSSNSSQQINVSDCTELKEETSQIHPLLIPNPTSGISSIVMLPGQKILKVEVYDALGRVITKPELFLSKGSETDIDLTGLKNGVYFAHIFFENGIVFKKVILN